MVEYFTGVNLIQWASGCYGMKLTSGSGYLNVRFRPKADVHISIEIIRVELSGCVASAEVFVSCLIYF